MLHTMTDTVYPNITVPFFLFQSIIFMVIVTMVLFEYLKRYNIYLPNK